jgi:hypothetical protein
MRAAFANCAWLTPWKFWGVVKGQFRTRAEIGITFVFELLMLNAPVHLKYGAERLSDVIAIIFIKILGKTIGKMFRKAVNEYAGVIELVKCGIADSHRIAPTAEVCADDADAWLEENLRCAERFQFFGLIDRTTLTLMFCGPCTWCSN